MHADLVALKFLEIADRDIAAGGLRPVEQYLREFPGREDTVAAEYARLTAATVETTASTAARRIGGRYRVIDPLGRGGFAEVYLAEDEQLRRRVAVKVLCGLRALSPEWRSRLRREAEATNLVRHDGVCPVHDIGFDDDVPYLVMPWIDGRPLDRVLAAAAARGESAILFAGGRDARGRRDGALLFLERLARILAAAHAAGVVHRDVKPANVLVRPDGTPALIDFGLAALASAESLGSRSGSFGTPAYAAPEVLHGAFGEPDPRVDVWGLGVLLFECLTLRRPFAASADRSLASSVLEDPVPRLPNDCGRDLQAVLETALARTPAARYPDAARLADDLARVRRGEPVEVRAAGPLRRAWAWARARPLRVGTGLAAAALATSGVVVTAMLWIRGEELRNVAAAVGAVAATMRYLTSDVAALERAGVPVEDRVAAAEDMLATARRLRAGVGASALVDRSLAEVLVALGALQIQLGRRDAGARHVAEALALRQALDASDPVGDADRAAISHASILLGDVDSHFGRTELALARYRQAMSTDEQLRAASPTDPKRVSDVGFGHLRVAHMLQRLSRLDTAWAEVGAAVQRLLEAERLDPDEPARSGHVAEALLLQAGLATHLDRPREERIARVDEAVRRLRDDASRFGRSAAAWQRLAGAMHHRARLAPAGPDRIDRIDAALEAARCAVALQPTSADAQLTLTALEQYRSSVLAELGRAADAIAASAAALVGARRAHALDPAAVHARDVLVSAWREYCDLLHLAGRSDDADREAAALRELATSLWRDGPGRGDGWRRLVGLLMHAAHPQLRDLPRARELLREARERGVLDMAELERLDAGVTAAESRD